MVLGDSIINVAIVLNQHNPTLCSTKKNIKAPMLWLAAEIDAVISLKIQYITL